MKNYLRKLIYFYLFIHFNFTAFSQIDSEKDQQFFEKLYNFQFSDADSLLATIDSIQEPSHFNFLKAHYMRWCYLPIHQQNEKILKKYNRYLEATDYQDDEKEDNYHYVNSALLRAEFNYNQGNYYKSFQNGAKVYDVVKDHLESKPQQDEVKFLASLYHYYYQYYKTENPVFGTLMWFFKEGDKEKGLLWLEEVAQGNSILATEALVYLSHIYLRLENQPHKALGFALQLLQKHPNNLKFHELVIESHIATNNEKESVLSLIQKLESSEKTYFKKYGVCYNAIYMTKFNETSKDEKEFKLEEALKFIQNNGGGNHLSSLLYNSLYELTENDLYLKEKIEIEAYKYSLTGYLEKDLN
ncbi:hypothetical protein ABWH96_05790 [Marivirga tractuosa]|uniref:hypothetical protein n=1 Tax=Marivirga tractuosa TaxID=1006 RepID=UPI0035CE915D